MSGLEVLRERAGDDVFPRTLLLTGDIRDHELAEALELARQNIPIPAGVPIG